jgi:PAS domain S-box-containing protein
MPPMSPVEAGPTVVARSTVHQAMAFAAEQLLQHRPTATVLEAVLEPLAQAMAANRGVVVVAHSDEQGVFGEIAAEWAAPGLPLLGADLGLSGTHVEDIGLARWLDVLRGGRVIQGLVRDLPAEERPFWEGLGITALAMIPLFADGAWHGAMLLATPGDGPYSGDDIEALMTTGRMIGTALEREGHRAALDASEARFRRLADNAADIVYRFEIGPEPHFSYLSPSLARITGFTPDDCYADPMLFLRQVHPDDRQELDVRLRDPGAPGEPLPLRWTTKDGQAIWLELSSIPVHVDGRLVAIEGIARDVTHQRELSHALQERVKELTCLSQVRHFVHELDDVAQVCRSTAEVLMTAMQWPDLAGARVQVDATAHAVGSVEGAGLLAAPITASGTRRGHVLVGYHDPALALLPEEEALVDAVATILGSWLEQAETAAALAESEARFRRLFDNAPDIVYRYRVTPDPRLEYISPAVEHITGHTTEEHLQDPVIGSRLIHSDDQQLLIDRLRGNGSGEPFLVRFLTKDGRVRWTEHRHVLVHDEDGVLIATEGIGRDVTERIETIAAVEQRVREQTAVARLRQLALTGDGPDLLGTACELVAETLDVEIVGVAEITADGREILVRAGYGWRDGEIGHTRMPLNDASLSGRALGSQGPVVLEDVGGDTRASSAFLDRYGVVAAGTVVIGGRAAPYGTLDVGSTVQRRFTSEETRFLQSVANILGDVIERDRADDELARSERNFRTIAEHSPDIIARYDRDLRHLYVNETVTEKTGLPAASFMGRTNRELGEQPLELIELWEQTGRQVLATGEKATIYYTYPGPQGPVHFQSHLIPELDPDGKVETVLVVARDLTERHHADAQRRDALSRIVTAQEEERARIAGDIHDDSIQVMTAAGMRLEVLKREFPEASALPAIVRLEETVRHSISRLRSLMFELRPPELDREGIAAALRAYLETAMDSGDLEWELVDQLVHEVPPDVRTVLYRIAQESLTNMRKHARASLVRVLLDEADGGVRLRLHDDGVGFHVDDLDHIRPHHLGVVSMRERAEGAGGRLDITSLPGQGTVITAWIPTQAVAA